jgi:hypothetical protein
MICRCVANNVFFFLFFVFFNLTFIFGNPLTRKWGWIMTGLLWFGSKVPYCVNHRPCLDILLCPFVPFIAHPFITVYLETPGTFTPLPNPADVLSIHSQNYFSRKYKGLTENTSGLHR